MSRSSVVRVILAAAVFCLAGCGGSGNGSGGGVAPPPAPFTKQPGTVVADAGFDVAVDNTGNVYVAGETAGNLDGQANAGGTDVFLVKYDALGNRIFTVLVGASGADLDPRVAVDNNGNVYIAGTTDGTLDPAAASPGGGDVFVARMSPDNGAVAWIRQIGGLAGSGPSVESDPSLAVDGDGNVYASCTTRGILDNAVVTGTGAGDGLTTDLALMKFDPAGLRLWTRQHGTAEDDTAAAIAVSPAGNVYVAGDTLGVLDAGTASPGAGISFDLYAARFLPDGTLDWVRQRGSSGSELVFGIAVDNVGDAYVTGLTDGGLDNNVNAGTGTVDLFLAKFDALGTWQFTLQPGTPADDVGFGAATDAAGNVYLAGVSTGDLGGGGNAGLLDALLVKYDPTGALQYVRQFGSALEDGAFDLAVASDGAVYMTGFTFGGLDGNENPDPSGTTPDAFVVKFNGDGEME